MGQAVYSIVRLTKDTADGIGCIFNSKFNTFKTLHMGYAVYAVTSIF